MPDRRLVVVGVQGWLGSAIVACDPSAIPVGRGDTLTDALKLAGPDAVIVNAAGRRSGSQRELREANLDLLERLLDTGQWVVHLGSAAEYGLSGRAPVVETAQCQPSSDYGVLKLQATQLAQASGRATVLRLFNVVDDPPQTGSPLHDIRRRILAGVHAGNPVEVLSGGTQRDYVSRSFVAESVVRAAELKPAGLFNVGSGIPVAVTDIATWAVCLLGSDVPVHDRQEIPPSAIWCDPAAWQAATGLRQRLSAPDVAAFLTGRPAP